MKSYTASYAERELEVLSKSATDPNNRPVIEEFSKEIVALCEAFGNSGQSGGSAPYTATALSKAIKKLCLQEPICPITGISEEWIEVGKGIFQNNRCSAVFKYLEDKAYYLDAIVWKGDTWNEDKTSNDWDTFSGIIEGITSRQFIKSFPFTPKTFYIDVTRIKFNPKLHKTSDAVSTGLDGDVVYFLKDKRQLKDVWKYYDKYHEKLFTTNG